MTLPTRHQFAEDGALKEPRVTIVGPPSAVRKIARRRRKREGTPNILALDLGTRTGWCLAENSAIISGIQTFDVKRGESPGMRYVRLNRWLDEVGARVDIVIYELQHSRGGAATEIAAGFASHVQAWCARRKIEHTSVHTATLKKFACGHGRADKSVIIEAVRRRWKPDVRSDDEADAVALLHWGLQELVGRHEQDQILRKVLGVTP